MEHLAVVQGVRLSRNTDSGNVVLWLDVDGTGDQLVATDIFPNVEVAHTWLVSEGFIPFPGADMPPELGGLYDTYVRLVPVVLL